MKALALVHEPDGPSGEIGAHLASRGFDVTEHVITESLDEPNRSTGPLPDLEQFDLLVVLGSVRSLTRKEEVDSWIHDELDALAAAHTRNQPILGICFGGQLLAEALGGTVEPSPVTEIGWHRIQPTRSDGMPIDSGPWMQWHHDRFHAPAEAALLAISPAGQQLFRLGRSVGTQFHPEITVEMLDGWLAASTPDYLEQYHVDPVRLAAETRRLEPNSRAACRRLVDWFLDDVAFPAPNYRPIKLLQGLDP